MNSIEMLIGRGYDGLDKENAALPETNSEKH